MSRHRHLARRVGRRGAKQSSLPPCTGHEKRQPLSAPIDDRITAMEITVAPQGPQSIWAASEGNDRFHQLLTGTIP